MHGLMMDYQLTLPTLIARARTLFPHKRIVSRLPDKSVHEYTYADMARRSHALGVALRRLGVAQGDRVGTLAWNHYQHLEAYFAIPCMGAVLHTLNLRLHPDDLTYIVNHADDRVILVDETLLPLLDKIRDRIHPEHIVVMSQSMDAPEGLLSYEALLAEADGADVTPPDLSENDAAAMCYTSGTTGHPKGVLYTHRSMVLHAMASATADSLGVRERDVVMAVVPMFHVNAWGLPFTSTMVGATQVMPGPHLDAQSLLENIASEGVTFTAGVPTIWLGILRALDANPDAYDVSSLRTLIVGGSAAPRSMIEGFERRHGLNVVHAWGMTETSPIGTVANLTSDLQDAPDEERFAYRATQGQPVPFVEVRAQGEDGPVPWDAAAMGELEVRGPWIARAYYDAPDIASRFTDDGWFRTGDIVTIDPRGYVKIQDRSKDLIKSGGEWISSVELENLLMGHPAVAEAAVIPVAHPTWQERPLAVVVLEEGQSATAEELRAHLEPHVARWWLPDAYEFVAEIPKTSAGKFSKMTLRDRFKDYTLVDAKAGAPADVKVSDTHG